MVIYQISKVIKKQKKNGLAEKKTIEQPFTENEKRGSSGEWP